jgi:hypothetical protein
MGLVVLLAAAVALAGCHYKLPPHPKMERPDSAWRTSKADRAGYTVHMVEKALRLYKAKGREATVAYYNTPESVDGEWYVFIFDESDQLIAHANPDLIGMDLKGDLGLDSTGYRFGDLMLTATEEGFWVDYLFANLVSGNQGISTPTSCGATACSSVPAGIRSCLEWEPAFPRPTGPASLS